MHLPNRVETPHENYQTFSEVTLFGEDLTGDGEQSVCVCVCVVMSFLAPTMKRKKEKKKFHARGNPPSVCCTSRVKKNHLPSIFSNTSLCHPEDTRLLPDSA